MSAASREAVGRRRPRKRRPHPHLRFEEAAWAAGARFVAGVDEVGVGPLAGPVAAGAVLLAPGQRFSWFRHVRDSKLLTEEERLKLAPAIRATVPHAIGWASHEEVDRLGIIAARRLCIMRALEQLPCRPDVIISDALDLPLDGVRAEVRADVQSVTVAAASVIAKVARDALMDELCERYPGYGFCHNKGYATPEHKLLLRRRGPSPVHRLTWAPVAQLALPL